MPTFPPYRAPAARTAGKQRHLASSSVFRLSLSASEVPLQENQTDANAPGAASGSDVAMQPLGRVYLAKLAHLGSHNLSSTLHVSTSGTAMTEVIHPRSSVDDIYAPKDASSLSCYPQRQLDVHELLFEAGSFKAGSRQGKAGEFRFLSATRRVSTLHIEGCRILSLFEILVFTYRWHLQIANDGYKCVLLTPEGWHFLEIKSSAGSPPDSGVPGSDSTPDTSRPTAAVDQTESLVIHVERAARFLEAPLIFVVGSRTGTPSQLLSLDSSNLDLGWNFDRDTLRPFRCTIDGLRAYAKVTERLY